LKAVHGQAVGLPAERIRTVHDLDAALCDLEGGQVRIILPKLHAMSADVGEELVRVAPVQVAHGGGEQHDVPRRLVVEQHQLLHGSRPVTPALE
jgi:hypothetical protein